MAALSLLVLVLHLHAAAVAEACNNQATTNDSIHNLSTNVGIILLVSSSSEFDSSPSIAIIHDAINSILDQYDDDLSDIRVEITRVVESKQV